MTDVNAAPIFDQPAATPAATARDEAPQYVLPLVVRIERDAPPQRTDALETAARAVLTFLADPRVTEPDGEWAELVRAWTDGRIRKVVRRARGAEWRRAVALDGITVRTEPGALTEAGASAESLTDPGAPAEALTEAAAPAESLTGAGASAESLTEAGASAESLTGAGASAESLTEAAAPAEVRVYPPVPLDGWPKDLARLQVSGTDLTDAAPPAPVTDPATPVLWLNPDLSMSAGKAMAQVGHAAQIAWWELTDAQRKEWAADGFRLAVRTASRADWPALAAAGLPLVRDAGFTEIAPGSCTVVADLPVLR